LKRRVVEAALWFGLIIGNLAIAGDDIYVAYDSDAVPRFSTQPYDGSYSLYLRSLIEPPRLKIKTTPSSMAKRRAAMAPLILQVAKQYGMDPALLSAVAVVESGFNANAISPKGAIGTMQLIPKTAEDYGVINPYDMLQNLDGGTRYLKDLLAAHNGNIPLTLAAYNAGKTNVARHNQRIPPFDETMLYVPRVLAKMADYQRNSAIGLQ